MEVFWSYTRAALKEGESSLEEKVDLLLLQVQAIDSQVRGKPAGEVFRRKTRDEYYTDPDLIRQMNALLRGSDPRGQD